MSRSSPPAGVGSFPPPHSIRESRRARRISLRITPGKGLEVVLPLHADPACVPLVLDRYKGWIEKNLRRLSPPSGQPAGVLPERLLLKGGCEVVEIRRKGTVVPAKDSGREEDRSAQTRGAPVPPGSFFPPATVRLRRLELPDAPASHLLLLLKEWVREEARAYLVPLLRTLAHEHGFSYSGPCIRFQKSRWGSCSAKGGINLNACLLFLPEPLTRYILMHELCHTRQMNHSAAFWKLLFALDPSALAKDRAMRNAWRHVPDWLLKIR